VIVRAKANANLNSCHGLISTPSRRPKPPDEIGREFRAPWQAPQPLGPQIIPKDQGARALSPPPMRGLLVRELKDIKPFSSIGVRR
jgi:hypothetical protein